MPGRGSPIRGIATTRSSSRASSTISPTCTRPSRCISSRAWRQTTPGGRRSGRATRRPSRASRVRRPLEPERGTVHGCHLYTLLVDDAAPRSRDDVLAALAEWKIGAGVHYTALHTHPYYARALGHEPGDFPNALEIGERTFSIPLSPKLTDEDVEDVVAAVCDALS